MINEELHTVVFIYKSEERETPPISNLYTNCISPFSKKTEYQRICELNRNVENAKLALEKFTEPRSVSIKMRIYKFFG